MTSPPPADERCRYASVADKFPRYIDKTVSRVDTRARCERECDNSREFVCRSYSLYTTAGQCLLSGDDEGQ